MFDEETNLWNEAIEIAQRYCWEPEFPNLCESLCNRIIPDGFPREVGKTIALFMAPPILTLGSKEKAQQEYQENRRIGQHLARLRLLLAELAIRQRRSNQEGSS